MFPYEAEADSLVALGTGRTPMGRGQRELGLDRFAISNAGRSRRSTPRASRT